MDANNTTTLLDVGNATGDAGTVALDLNFVFLTIGVFVVSWIILCVVMYFIVPFFARFGDMRSRAAYSAVYSMPFAVIFALWLGGTMSILAQSGFIVLVLVAFIILFGLVMIQNFLLGLLISKGIIKMQSKRGPQGPVKGKRK